MTPRLRTATLVATFLVAGAQPMLGAVASDGPRFGKVHLRTGLEMHYAEQGDRRGKPVIMLHGYSDSWFSYSLVLGRLPSNIRAYAIDLRGHGKSSRPYSRYAMTDLAADVVAFMDAKGIERATVVGHSMGGFVAQRVAQLAPQRVARLVLISTATSAPSLNGLKDLKAAVDAFRDTVPAAFVRDFQIGTAHSMVPTAFMERAIGESLGIPARVWRAAALGMSNDARPRRWPDVRIPTLVLWGERDAYAPRREQDALLGLIPGAKLRTYANTGHALHWERPADVARDVIAFVTSDSALSITAPLPGR